MSLFILGGAVASAQEAFLKEWVGKDKIAFCLYPSTLRMVNLKHNDDFDQFSRDLEKFLFYSLEELPGNTSELEGYYLGKGFEEYARAYGNDLNMLLLGKTDRMVGWFSSNDRTILFYAKGNLDLAKIPTLVRSFNNEDYFNVLDFKQVRFDD